MAGMAAQAELLIGGAHSQLAQTQFYWLGSCCSSNQPAAHLVMAASCAE